MIPLPVREKGTCCTLPPVNAARLESRAGLLKALADPTRLAMLSVLADAESPVCICDFTNAFELSQPTISHHMAKLKRAGLVESFKRGLWIHYRLHRDLPQATRRLLEAAAA